MSRQDIALRVGNNASIRGEYHVCNATLIGSVENEGSGTINIQNSVVIDRS
jgi:hypothetical protein